jgi:hypothetical protein
MSTIRTATASVEAAITATVLDYFEGWYDGDAARVARALHPSLAKRAYAQDPARTPALASLTAEQMIAYTAAGDGRAAPGFDRRIAIDVADVSHDIASVVVHSARYDEYLHLVATPDGWRIVNALWRFADGHDRAD